MTIKKAKIKRQHGMVNNTRAAERVPMMNQNGEFIDSSVYKGWEVEIQVQTDTDVQTSVFMYCVSKNPGAAAQTCNKYFDIWHRPEPFGGRYPEIADIKKARCYDITDLKEAWRKILLDAVPNNTMRVYNAGSQTLPFVFMAYPAKSIPSQHNGKPVNW